MSTTDSAESESEVAALRDELRALKAKNEQLRDHIDELRARNDEQADRIDLLLRERAEDRQRIAELEDYRAANEHDKATIRQQVTEVERTDVVARAESDDSAAQDDSMRTPMEQAHPGRRGWCNRPCDRQRRARGSNSSALRSVGEQRTEWPGCQG